MEVTGDNVKIRIYPSGNLDGAGQVYAAAHAAWDDRAKLTPLNTSPNEGFTQDVPASATFSATIISASYDPALNMFQAPLNIRSGSRIGLLIYPAGLDNSPVGAAFFLIESSSGDHDANSAEGLAPVTFRGRSQGYYFLSGDSQNPPSP